MGSGSESLRSVLMTSLSSPADIVTLGSQPSLASICALTLGRLDVQILTTVLLKLDDPTDVAASASTCKRLRSLSGAAPLQLRVGPDRFIRAREEGTRDRLRSFMLGLSHTFRGDPARLFDSTLQ